MRTRVRIAAGVALLLACCEKTPEPTPSSPFLPEPPAPAPQPTLSASPSPTATVSAVPVEITWADPPGWQRSPKANPARKATYVVPRAPGDKEDGELGVFYFGPGQGGSIDANVDRWVKQFKDAPRDKVNRADREANGLRQHTVEVESGTFDGSMMPHGAAKPKPNYGLLGAIVEAPSGRYFFKLTGPKATVQKAKKGFYALLDSVKPGS